MIKHSAIYAAAMAAVMAAAQSAAAYPERPIRMVVPFAAGGGSDISARLLADGIGPLLGQTVVIDNRGGAGSSLGTDIVTKATPDGYTLLLGNISPPSPPDFRSEKREGAGGRSTLWQVTKRVPGYR